MIDDHEMGEETEGHNEGENRPQLDQLLKTNTLQKGDRPAPSNSVAPDVPSINLGSTVDLPNVDLEESLGTAQVTSPEVDDQDAGNLENSDLDIVRQSQSGEATANVEADSGDTSSSVLINDRSRPDPVSNPLESRTADLGTTPRDVVAGKNSASVSVSVGQAEIESADETQDREPETSSAQRRDNTIGIDDLNEGPVATDDAASTGENAAISVDVLANDTDVDAGDGQTLSSVSLVSGGGGVGIVSGQLRYDPGGDYDHLAVGETATVTIDYTIEDNAGATDTGTLTLTVTGSNDGPTVAAALADQTATEDAAFSYQIPAGSFDDLDASDTLAYTAALADGSALPAWLSFDPATRTFSGTPENGDVGALDVRVTATDPHGGRVDETFTLTTANTNDTPHDLALDNASVDENAANGTVIGQATGSDADSGDTLTYSLADDAGGRFAIDSATGQITVADGSLLNHEAADSHDVTVRVTDVAGDTYDETFTINVGDVNEGPEAADDSASSAENAVFKLDVVTDASDPDAGDSLNLSSVSLTSGSGSVSIDRSEFPEGELRYDPGGDYDHLAVGETATVTIDYTIEDNAGATDTGTLTLTVTGSNDGPTVAAALADQTATEDAAFSYQIPAGSFDDLDASDTLAYTAALADGSALPAWLSFDPATRTFSGTPENGDVGALDVRVTATDPHGGRVDETFTLTTANTNDTPHDLALDNASVDENAANGTVIGQATGSDADSGDTLTYSLADDAGGRFAIDSATGQITVADGSLLNHEAADSHDVTVRVTDVAGDTYDETFTINVGDVNEGPEAADDSASSAENAVFKLDVVTDASDPDAGDSLNLSSVSLTSGSGSVSIDRSEFPEGELRYDPGGDYDHLAVGETATVTIDYTIEDNAGATDTGTLTLTVTGSNDGPTVAAALADQTATEDAAFSYQIPAGSFDDLDASDTLAYTAALADGSALPAWLSFDPATRTFSGTPENGDVGALDVRVTATDPHGGRVDETFTLTTANTNDTPHDLALDNASVDENAANGTVIGQATGSDADSGDTLTYSLADDAGGRFAIDSATGQITVADGSLLNHEAADSHDVTVRVTDVAGDTYDETFTINVGDVNEGPEAADDSASSAENAVFKLDVVTDASDPDAGDSLNLSSVSLTSGSGSVSIDRSEFPEGELRYDPGGDYDHLAVGETATVTIDYTIEDNAGATDTGTLTLTVTGSNDGPTVAAALADQTATEDAAFSYQIPAGSFDDLDASDTLAYTAALADGSALPAWLSFDPATRTFSGTPENGDVGALDVRVTATDPHGGRVDETFTLTTANTNDTPHDLALDNASVDENAANGTVIGQATGSDADSGDTLTYSLADDAGGRFAIDSATGQITVADGSLLNHEAADSHDVTVRVTDVAGDTYDETFTINVGDVNEGPEAADDSASSAENAVFKLDVVTDASDPDAGDSLNLSSVSLTSGSGSVSIDRSEFPEGELRYDPGGDYDHLAVGETATVTIDYTIEDNAGATDTGTLTLTVTGSNDGPTVAAALADQTATEDAAFSYQIPAGSFDDLDASDTLAYTAALADGSALPAWLSFDPATRTFSGTPENGDVGALDVRVTATDPHGGRVDETFTLTTANTNDTPHDLALDNASVDENAANGTVIGQATGSDADSGDTLTYSLADDAGGRFAIDSATGQITVADGSLLNHEAADSHDVTVRVTDVAGDTYDETFTINVGDVNEGPEAADDSASSAENAVFKLDVVTDASDPDAGDSLNLSSVSLTSGSGSVSIDRSEFPEGELRYDPGGDYDHLAVGETATVTIDYTIEDNAGATDTGTLTLTVTGSNDGPTVAAALADQTATEDAAFSYQIPAGSFDDLDASDTLAYTAALADGSALPAWLSFDPATRTFSGTPENGDVGALDVRVTATDPHGGRVDETFTLTTANTNDTPHDLALDNASVDENAANGTVIGQAAGSDADSGDTLTYSLADDAGGRFAIDSATGQITVADGSLLNHEAADSHDVTVRVTDVAGDTYDETFTINVGDVNEGPEAADDSASSAENAVFKLDVVTDASDPDAGDSLNLSSVSLTSGSGSVSIDRSEFPEGELRYDPGGDYDHLAVGETATVTIDYTIEDNAGATDTGTLTLTVTGSNDGPTVAAALADQTATEDAAFSYQIPAGSFDDLDASDTLAYTAALADGSALPAWLSFDPATRTFSGTPENGDVGALDVRVTATDPHGGRVDETFTLTTANTNDTPHDLALDNASVDENAANGTVIGQATGSDADSGDTLTYSLADDAGGRFAIDSATGQITVADGSLLNHEAADSHDVTVRVTDVAGDTYDETFTINVGDVNEGPEAADDSASSAENAVFKLDVVTDASDPDAGDSLNLSSVSLTSGSGSVSIDRSEFPEGELRYDPGGDYDHLAVGETATVTIDYTIEDNAGATDTGTLTLTVTGSNDGPTVAAALADQTATEDAAFSYQIPAGSFDDLDASDTLAYTAALADGSALPAWLSFDPATRTFSGTPENGDVGALDVRVTATDPHGGRVDETFTLTTANTNDTPHDLALDNASVDENAANGTVIGQAAGSDADSGDTLTYSLADDAGGRFAIDSATGQITVADGSLLNHEAADSHDVTVRVTDVAGDTYDETFTINVGDVAEDITLADGGATFIDSGVTETSVTGGAGSDTITGSANADNIDGGGGGWDALDGGDAGDTYYARGDGLADTYADTGTSGTDTIVLKSGTGSNFELTDQFDAAGSGIEVIDGSAVSGETLRAQTSGSQISWDFTGITLTGVDQIEGRSADDTITGSAGDDTIIGGGGADVIEGGAGTDTTVFSGSWANYTITESGGTYTVTDNVGSDGTDTVTGVETFRFADGDVAVADVLNDAPHDLALSHASVDENAANGTVVGTAAGSDADSGDTLTYSLTDDAGGRFAIDSTTGQITVADGSLLDHEAVDSHDVTVRVTDAAGETYDETFTVNVGDVNEGPTISGTSNNLITDGGFEDNTVGEGGYGSFSSFGAWESETGGIEVWRNHKGPASEGNSYIELDQASGANSIHQDVQTVSGETYTLTFDHSPRPGHGAADNSFEVYWNDTLIDTITVDGSGNGSTDWSSYSYTVTGTGGTDRLSFKEYDSNGSGALLDNIALVDSDGALTVLESADDLSSVGFVNGSDEDAGDTLTYSLTDDAGGRFTIDSSTGEIKVLDGDLLDYETATSHDITVRVTDAGGLTEDQTVTINVGDTDEVAPHDIHMAFMETSGAVSIEAENFHEVSSVGSNPWQVFSDGAASGGSALTTVNGGGGYTEATYNIDFATTGTYHVWVLGDGDDGGTNSVHIGFDGSRVTSTSGISYGYGSYSWQNAGVTIDVTEAGLHELSLQLREDGTDADKIILTQDGSFTPTGFSLDENSHDPGQVGGGVAENSANGTVVAVAAGSDETDDTLTYSLTDDAGGRFAIDGTTGEITVADGSLLDYETATSHEVTVQVTDSGGLTYDETFTVNVGDVIENQAATDLQFKAEAGTSTTVISEDFESGATGWSDNTTTSGGGGLDGNYLGGFFGTGGAQTVYKTFSLSGDQDSVTVTFDFYEFDTWNGEEFKIWVDDVLISTDVFYTQQYYGYSDSSTYGSSTSGTSSNLGQGIYNDQTHSYSFTIDSSATTIKVGFGSNLDESASDNTESWGIDNFEIIENQGGTALPVEQPAADTVATGEIVSVGGHQSVDRWSLTHSGGDLTIDMLADGYDGSNLDSIVYLYRDNGGGSYTLVGSNDDGAAGSDGSTSGYDSYLSASDLTAGDYIIAVGSWGTSSSEAIASGDTVTANTTGAYQMTISGNATLNGIATDPSDGSAWGDPNGHATVVSASGGGLDAGTTLATLEAIDPDSGDSASYSLANDAGGRYSINASGELSLDVAHDDSATASDSITVRTTDGAGDTYDETFNVALGSSGADTVNGGAGSDIVHGLAGDDTIDAGAGDDLVYGGSGDDTIHGGAGDDTLYGDAGDDLFVLLQGQGNDTVSGGTGGGWTDIIELQDAGGGSNIGTYGTDWTLVLDTGSIEASDTDPTDGWLDLTDDAAGTITMQDGTEIDFTGVEYLQW